VHARFVLGMDPFRGAFGHVSDSFTARFDPFGYRLGAFSPDSGLTNTVLHLIRQCVRVFTSMGCTMTTTQETATVNRVAGYFTKNLPEIPDSDFDRQAVYTESIMQAVLAMRELLGHGDKAVVLAAAQELFALERTRLRHRRNISGCRVKDIPQWQADQELSERLDASGPPSPKQLENEAVAAHGREAQAELRKVEEAKPANERKKVHSSAGHSMVVRCLKKWGVTARSIPAGSFWSEYLRRPVVERVVVPRAPVVKPASAPPVPHKVDPTTVADWNVDFGNN